MMRPSLTDAAALPVWYSEQLQRVDNLAASIRACTDPEVRDALVEVAKIHTARAQVLEELMREALAR